MSDEIQVVCADPITAANIEAAKRHNQVLKNIKIIGCMENAGLPMEFAGLFGAKPVSDKLAVPRELTKADRERIAAAAAKRLRRAMKRSAQQANTEQSE